MSFEDEIVEQLADRARQIDAVPDAEWVQAEAGRRHVTRRVRTTALGAVVLIAVGLAGVVYVANGRPNRASSTSEIPASTDATESTDLPTETLPALATTGSPDVDPAADAAWPLLERTTQEIYRRTLTDREIVVRRSDLSWAEFFDLEWRAPTGSAELCMGDYVLFVSDPATPMSPGNTWYPVEVFDEFEGEVAVDMSQLIALVRTTGPADEVAIIESGDEYDRAGFVDGLAVLDMTDVWNRPDSGQPELVLVTSGVTAEPIPFAPGYGRATEEFRQECQPGPPPTLPLPPSGVQPLDPVAAEAQILDAYARALDRTMILPDENPPSVDDITGIPEAAAEVDAGEMAEVAATAEHDVEELVFTAPDEAWFRYKITTTAGTFTGQFGIARFNGSVWQITRDTICQDLQRAGGTCVPAPDQNVPPEPAGWSEVLADHERSEQLYWSWDCLPPPFGPQECEDDIGGIGD
ncbi:MAG TPA: hypothetical protein VMY16_13080 [Ilumatobacteraceae bacterium]|nr:hypothetical protein [Ilumatobacteraceae bacterium]HUV19602.1 hypothetical protein [Ilumatobacteraceae bacterium]